ncbi:MAG: glycosyltransferase [Acidobacteriaceae bacterium]
MRNYPANADCPLVSAVIPTRGRPAFLLGAVRSALRQTWPKIEVIVVIDGPDPATEAQLELLHDARVRTLMLERPYGGSDARNAGVRAARGEWIAFLDDDDEWLPEKIERQMRAVTSMPDWFPVISCRVIAQSPSVSRVLPLRTYQAAQPVADYLFCREGLRDPGGLLQTSTLLASRELLLAVPFQSGLPMHQDWDWTIRVAAHKGVGLRMLAQPLAVWRVEDDRASVGRSPDWRASLAWIRRMRPLISPRAFSWFIAVQCAWRVQASRAGLSARLALLWLYLVHGRPELRSSLLFFVFGCVPTGLRKKLSSLLRTLSLPSEPAPGLQLAFVREPASAALRRTFR